MSDKVQRYGFTGIGPNRRFAPMDSGNYIYKGDYESLRAQVATLTAERNKLSELWGESQTELARVKALVTEGQTVGYYVYVSEHQNAYLVEDADEAIDDLTNHGAQITELIARPNLEQKP